MSVLRRRLARLEITATCRDRAKATGCEPEPRLPAALVAHLHHGPHAPLPPDLRAGVDLFLAEHASRDGAQ